MIAVVDTGGGNIASVLFALERLGKKAELTDEPMKIERASHVFLPGVGAAGAVMKALQKKNLVSCLRSLKQPVLGICLGMQILFAHSDEDDARCLGIIEDGVSRFPEGDLCVPHTGWNRVKIESSSPVWNGIEDESYFYFVHSYRAPLGECCVGSTDYGARFASFVKKNNFFGAQFHPERSGAVGARLLENFTRL